MQKSWEKIVLAVSLLLLALGAVGLALTFPTKEDIGGTANTAVKGASVSKIDPKAVESLSQGWLEAPKWSGGKHLLFVSDQYLFDKKEQKIMPASDDTLIEGIPLKWLKQNNLDITATAVALGDPDGDGFSNKVEYESKTDPKDPASHPPFLSVLRLKAFDSIPFRLKFQSYNDLNGEKVFQINLLDVTTRRSRLVKIGDDLEGYKVTHFEQKVVTKENANTHVVEQVDESTLTIEKPEIGFKIDLVLNKVTDSPESTARFIMLLPGKLDTEIRVKRDNDFAIPQEPATKYLLLRVDDSGAVIRNTATKEEINVPKVTEQDYAGVPLAPKSAENKGN